MGQMLEQELNKLCDEQPFHTGWYLKKPAHRCNLAAPWGTWLSRRRVPARLRL